MEEKIASKVLHNLGCATHNTKQSFGCTCDHPKRVAELLSLFSTSKKLWIAQGFQEAMNLISEVIGEPEIVPHDYDEMVEAVGRNKLRAEQRKRLAALLPVEGVSKKEPPTGQKYE